MNVEAGRRQHWLDPAGALDRCLGATRQGYEREYGSYASANDDTREPRSYSRQHLGVDSAIVRQSFSGTIIITRGSLPTARVV